MSATDWTRKQMIAHLELHDWTPLIEPGYWVLIRGDGRQVYLARFGSERGVGAIQDEARDTYLARFRESWQLQATTWDQLPPEVLMQLGQAVLGGRHDQPE